MMIAHNKMVAAVMVAATCAFGSAASAAASPVVLAGPDTWTSWTTSQLMSGQFWARWSYDPGGYANVGYFLSGQPGSDVPGFYVASPHSTPPHLGGGSTTFALYLPEPMDFSHLLSVTGWNDEFGLFDVSTGERYPLFRAWETMGQTTTFYPSGIFGLYLANGEGQTWYSTGLDGGRSHFALFQGTDAWYLGVEDVTYTTNWTADWDYNDVIIKWAEAERVPEVGSMSMLGLALLSLGAARRRWLM